MTVKGVLGFDKQRKRGCKCAGTKGWSEQRGRHGLQSEEDEFITRVHGTVNQNLDKELGF